MTVDFKQSRYERLFMILGIMGYVLNLFGLVVLAVQYHGVVLTTSDSAQLMFLQLIFRLAGLYPPIGAVVGWTWCWTVIQ